MDDKNGANFCLPIKIWGEDFFGNQNKQHVLQIPLLFIINNNKMLHMSFLVSQSEIFSITNKTACIKRALQCQKEEMNVMINKSYWSHLEH